MRTLINALLVFLVLSAPAVAQPYGTSGTLGPVGAAHRTCSGQCVVVAPSGAWQPAIEGAASGSIVLLDAGTYTPSGTLDVPAGVTVANHAGGAVTINGALTSWGSGALIEGVTVNAPSSQFAVLIQSLTSSQISNVELKNVEVRGGTGDGVRIKGNVANVTVRNSLFDGGLNNHGLLVECNADLPPCSLVPDDILITNNSFTKTDFPGGEDLLQIEGQGDVTITHNDFSGNQTGEQCIDFKRSGRAGASVVLAFNDVDGRQGSGCAHGPLLITQPEAGSLLVEGNHFNGGSSLFRATPLGARVQNNIFRGTSETTVASTNSRMTLGFNTFLGTGNGLTFGDSTGVPNQLVVTNNIFSGTIFRGTSSWGNERSFNLLFGTTGSTLGSCPTCISGNPLLGGAFGYDLQEGSPAIDAAGPFAVAQDIDGVARPQGAASDIGAYELEGEQPPVDTTPPSIPQGLTVTVASSQQVDLSWQASTDDVGVTGYDVFRMAVQVASVTGTTYSDAGLTPGTYTYRVRAKDAAGNASELSDPATATIDPDDPPPVGMADVKVAASNHDAEYSTSGSIRNGDQSDLEMVLQGSTRQQVCVLFATLPIPPGATITVANIQFTADSGSASNVSSGSGSLLFRAIDEDQQTACGSSAASRPKTAAGVTWSAVPVWAPGAKTTAQQTPNLAPVVQELADRVDWGGNIAFWVTSTSSIRRTAESFNGSAAKAAVLHVEWTD